MVAEHLAVIAGEDDQGIVGEAELREGGENPPDFVVHQGDHRVIRRDDPLDLGGAVLGEAAGDPRVALLRRGGQDGGAVRQLRRATERGGDGRGVVAVHPFLRGDEGVVRVVEVGPEEERSVGVAPLPEEIDRPLADPAAVVRLRGERVEADRIVPGAPEPVGGRRRIEGRMLRLQPAVIGVLRRAVGRVVRPFVDPEAVVGVAPLGAPAVTGRQVHLADHAAIVSGGGERRREAFLAGRQRHPIGPEAVRVGIARGQQAGARGRADRTLHVAALEEGALGGERIEVRRADRLVPVAAERVVPLLVGAEQQDIRSFPRHRLLPLLHHHPQRDCGRISHRSP